MPAELTAIIVNHDTRDDLLACLQSIAGVDQGLRLRIVVVDNASSDGSAEAVEGAFPNAEILRTPANLGFAAACNLGLERARAPFVALLNADVVCAPNCLALLVAFLRRHPEVAAVGPRMAHPNGTLQTSAYRFPTLAVECASILGLRPYLPTRWLRSAGAIRRLLPDTGHLHPHDEARPVDFATGACLVLRRDAVEQVGALDATFFMYYEEIDLCRRLQAAGWKTFHLPEATAVHHLGGSARRVPVLSYLARQQSRLRFHAKHQGRSFLLVLRAALAFAAVFAL